MKVPPRTPTYWLIVAFTTGHLTNVVIVSVTVPKVSVSLYVMNMQQVTTSYNKIS